MTEWLMVVVLKTIVGKPTGGSNPSLSATASMTHVTPTHG